MSWIGAVAGLAIFAGAPAESDGYARCLEGREPLACVVERALRNEPETEILDLIAAGAVEAVVGRSSPRQRRVAGLAAGVARGERPSLSPAEAQYVLAIFSEVEFYDTGLPGDDRAQWLWPLAMSEPAADLGLLERLVFAALRADRLEHVSTLISWAPLNGRWTADERAGFASLVARLGRDWRAAEAWLASGGDRADGYDVDGIRREIDRARLHEGHDAAAAGRVVDALLAAEDIPLWFEDAVEALKAAGASEEMRRAAGGLAERGRRPDRPFEDRSGDLGSASMLLEAAGDREAALDAAREGAALTPRAVAERISLFSNQDPKPTAVRAQMANGFGTLPVERLYRLGAREEALEVGYLAGRDRYLAELDAGRRPDPAWIVPPQIYNELRLLAPALQEREARTEAAELLARLRLAPAVWAEAYEEELMMLAAIAGDVASVDAIFEAAVRNLDAEEAGGGSAIQLVIARRAADAELGRQQSR